jgi:hypothetical protein
MAGSCTWARQRPDGSFMTLMPPSPALDAQEIAAEGRKRRVRRPHVTDGIPSATIRSTVAKLTPMIAASSARVT